MKWYWILFSSPNLYSDPIFKLGSAWWLSRPLDGHFYNSRHFKFISIPTSYWSYSILSTFIRMVVFKKEEEQNIDFRDLCTLWYKILPLERDLCRVNDLYTSFFGLHDGASQYTISYCDYLNVQNYMKSSNTWCPEYEKYSTCV